MANYTVNINGVDYPVVNHPWSTIGCNSDEMNLKTMAVKIPESPSNSALRRAYDALLQRKLNSANEIADIKYRIEREKAEKERQQQERQQLQSNRFSEMFSPGFKQKQLAALNREQEVEFNRNDVGGKKYKKCKKISNKRKKHSRRRRRTHSRSKY